MLSLLFAFVLVPRAACFGQCVPHFGGQCAYIATVPRSDLWKLREQVRCEQWVVHLCRLGVPVCSLRVGGDT